MSIWIANITASQFEVCLQESRTFDGPHTNIMVVSVDYFYFKPFTKGLVEHFSLNLNSAQLVIESTKISK